MSAMLQLNQNWTSVPYESCYPQNNQLPKGKNNYHHLIPKITWGVSSSNMISRVGIVAVSVRLNPRRLFFCKETVGCLV